jgi:sugar phosphate isomerase/epimerase
MRYGVCTWTFGREPLASIARRVADVGLDGVELAGDLSLDPRQTRRLLADHGLTVLSITPENVDICHPDPSVRRPAVDYYLRLVDWAAELGAPLISCHGAVGRVRAVKTYAEERRLYLEAVGQIAARAREAGLRVALELLNRYEAHLLNTVAAGLRFLAELGADNVGLLVDAYHANIEEPDLPLAIWLAGDRLFLFHVADSNRQAVGRGHTDFVAVTRALRAIGYQGDIIFECVPPGPDPFTADKGPGSLATLETYLRESLALMQGYWEAAGSL